MSASRAVPITFFSPKLMLVGERDNMLLVASSRHAGPLAIVRDKRQWSHVPYHERAKLTSW